MARLLKILIAIGVSAWFFTFLTVDGSRYYAPSKTPTFEEFWALYGSGTEATPENPMGIMPIEEARSKYPDSFRKQQARYQQWLGQIAVAEQQRLAQIDSGIVPKWEHSAITAQWYAAEAIRGVGEWSRGFISWKIPAWYAGYLVLAVPLVALILTYCIILGEREGDRFRSGVALLLAPVGWYRLAVMLFLFLSSGLITGFFGGFVPFWWALCALYAVGFGLLFYHWFLRDA